MSGSRRAATRVLVIDDSVLVRQIVTRAFEDDPAIDVIGATRNGPSALRRAEALRPDVVVLDSPVAAVDGFPTLAELRSRWPELRAVIFGGASGGGAVRWAGPGATAFAFNPRGNGIGLSEARVRAELMPAIRRLGLVLADRSGERRAVLPIAPAGVIVIAVSTGGPDALSAVIGRLPEGLAVPILVVQHMPPDFTKLLAGRLDRQSALPVVEASAGSEVLPGHVYIAPGGRHMEIARMNEGVVVRLHDGPPENSCRPAADVLFRSAAEIYREQALAVVLTGMGRDGLRGAEAIRAAGGRVIAQSESTALIASMPGAIAAAGLANAVVALEEIGDLLTEHAIGSRS